MGIWSGIYPPIPNQPCDICESKIKVESIMVKIAQSGCVRSFSSHAQSNLCQSCKGKGWIIFGKADATSRMTYYNLKTQEFKSV